MAEDTGAVASHNQGEETDFMGPPRDWIDAFGRHFIPNRHTHLDEGRPDGRLEQQLRSPGNFAVAETFRRTRSRKRPNLHRHRVLADAAEARLREAEQVLREGLRNNPDNAHSCLNWAGFILKIITTSRGAEYLGSRFAKLGAAEAGRPAIGTPQIDQREFRQPVHVRAAPDKPRAARRKSRQLGRRHRSTGNRPSSPPPTPDDIQKHIDELKRKLADAANSEPLTDKQFMTRLTPRVEIAVCFPRRGLF